MNTFFKDTVMIRTEIRNALQDDPEVGVARRFLISRVVHRCFCSEYAVMKLIKAWIVSGHIISKKHDNKVFLYKHPKMR
jgi:hypothetical protein